MVAPLQRGARRYNAARFKEMILAARSSEPSKIMDSLNRLEMEQTAKEQPDQFKAGVEKLASILVDPKTNRQGLREVQEKLAMAEKVRKHLEALSRG